MLSNGFSLQTRDPRPSRTASVATSTTVFLANFLAVARARGAWCRSWCARRTPFMVRARPGIAQDVGAEAISLAAQLDETRRTRNLAQREVLADPACRFAEIQRRQDAVAKARPKPQATGRFAAPKPKSEIESLLAQQPQTTAQHVGHHKIPKLPEATPEPPLVLCVPACSPRYPSLRADRARIPLSGRSIRNSSAPFPTAAAES